MKSSPDFEVRMKTPHELEVEGLLFRICMWLGVLWGTLVAGFMILYMVIAMTAKA